MISGMLESFLNDDLEYALASKSGAHDRDELADRILFDVGESLHRQAERESSDRLSLLHDAAFAYYVSGHYARAYVILQDESLAPEPMGPNGLLRLFYRKEYAELQHLRRQLMSDVTVSDEELAKAIESGKDTVRQGLEQVAVTVLCQALSSVLDFARDGGAALDASIGKLEILRQVLEDPTTGLDPTYAWSTYVATLLLKEHRANSLRSQLATMLDELSAGSLANRYVVAAANRAPPFVELWRSQIAAVSTINAMEATGRPNFLVKAPTSAGKTNIAELTILRRIMDSVGGDNKKCIYVAPFRSLASEIERKLRRHLGSLKVRVAVLYGGFEVSLADRLATENASVLVATPEKVSALFRYLPNFAKEVGLIVLDEGHQIERGVRGLRYEMLIQRLVRKYSGTETRITLMSALLGSTELLSKWISGSEDPVSVISSNYRPTKTFIGTLRWNQKLGIASEVVTHVSDSLQPGFKQSQSPAREVCRALPRLGTRKFPRKSDHEITALISLTYATRGATLVYAPRPTTCNKIAEGVLDALRYVQDCIGEGRAVQPLSLTVPKTSTRRARLWNRCIRIAERESGPNALVTQALRAGFVVHHRELPERLRDELAILIEEGVLSLTIATSTIMNGINSPVRTILIHALNQYDEDTGKNAPMATSDFLNLAGRAGRAMHESEGTALVCDYGGSTQAMHRQVQRYVASANRLTVESKLRTFLVEVAEQWRATHENADVARLCQELADEHIDWMTDHQQRLLDELDTGLLASMEEQGVSGSPDAVQKIIQDALFVLEEQPNSANAVTSLAILTSRVTRLQKLTDDKRKRFYGAGLSIRDCLALDANRDKIVRRLRGLNGWQTWSDQQRSEAICVLRRDVLSSLRILGDERHGPCVDVVLQNWLSGRPIEAISELPEVKSEFSNLGNVTKFIDDLCGYRLPTALYALKAYSASLLADEENDLRQQSDTEVVEETYFAAQTINEALGAFASMVSLGVSSPKAATFRGMGLDSRDAAIICAAHHTGPIENLTAMYEWFESLDIPTLLGWGCDHPAIEDVKEFQVRISEDFSWP